MMDMHASLWDGHPLLMESCEAIDLHSTVLEITANGPGRLLCGTYVESLWLAWDVYARQHGVANHKVSRVMIDTCCDQAKPKVVMWCGVVGHDRHNLSSCVCCLH